MKYLNIKRFVERNMLGGLIEDIGVEFLENKVPGFWDIVAEYFTHK